MSVVMVYENSFLGLTTSQWLIIALGIAWVITLMILIFLYTKLGPTEGYIISSIFGKGDDKNLGIVIQNHNVSLKRLNYFSGVFDCLGLTWLARKPEAHRFGSCNVEFLIDYWGITMDPKINVAAQQFIDTWNSDLSPAACCTVDQDYSWMPEEREKIESFESLYAAIEKAPSDAQIRIKAFSYVPFYELLRYFPKNLCASDLTGYLEAMKKVSAEKAAGMANSYLPLICLVGGLLLGVGLAYIGSHM